MGLSAWDRWLLFSLPPFTPGSPCFRLPVFLCLFFNKPIFKNETNNRNRSFCRRIWISSLGVNPDIQELGLIILIRSPHFELVVATPSGRSLSSLMCHSPDPPCVSCSRPTARFCAWPGPWGIGVTMSTSVSLRETHLCSSE